MTVNMVFSQLIEKHEDKSKEYGQRWPIGGPSYCILRIQNKAAKLGNTLLNPSNTSDVMDELGDIAVIAALAIDQLERGVQPFKVVFEPREDFDGESRHDEDNR